MYYFPPVRNALLVVELNTEPFHDQVKPVPFWKAWAGDAPHQCCPPGGTLEPGQVSEHPSPLAGYPIRLHVYGYFKLCLNI